MALKLSNNATSTLAANINAAATTLAIQSADEAKFPLLSAGDWFPVTIVDAAGNTEVMRCTARVGVTLTVTRAQEGTTAKNFTANSRVDLRLTAGALAAFGQITGAAFIGPVSAPSFEGETASFSGAVSSPSISAKLDKAQNLSDLPDKATARINLGVNDASNLGTGTLAAARLPAGAYPNLTGSTDATTDFNSLTAPGWQPAIYKGTNPHGPGDDNWYFVHNIVWSSSITQIAIHYASPATTIAMRGLYSGTWSGWTKFVTQDDLSSALSSALANYAPLSGAVFTGGIASPRVSTYGDTYSYMSFLNAARTIEKAYIGISNSPWTDLIIGVGSGDIYLRKGGTDKFRVATNYNFSYNNLIVTGTAADYGISGTAGPGYGGVIGWSANHNFYGILGYNNAYSLYGVGQLYNAGDASIVGSLNLTGQISNNGSYIGSSTVAILGTLGPTGDSGYVYLRPKGYNDPGSQTYIDYFGTMRVANHFYAASSVNAGGDVTAGNSVIVGGSATYYSNGNINGSVWGGYLSSYLSANYMTYGSLPAQLASMSVGALGTYAFLNTGTTSTVSPGAGLAGSGLKYTDTDGVTGSGSGTPGGSWRCMGQVYSANKGTLFLRYA